MRGERRATEAPTHLKWSPISWQAPRTEARELDWYTLEAGPFVYRVRQMGSHSLQAGENARVTFWEY